MITITLITAIILILVWKLWSKTISDPLDKIPGPKGLPILGSALTFIGCTPEEMFIRARGFRKDYGDRFIIKVLNRRILQTNSPDDVEVILTNSRNISKNLPYKMLAPWLGSGLLLSTGKLWQKRRKILTPAFHFNILKKFAAIIEDRARELVGVLEGSEGQEVDVVAVISDFTLHTICETAMGTRLDTDKSTATIKYKTSILNIGSQILQRLTTVWLRSEVVFKLLPAGRRFQRALSDVHQFADDVILERKLGRATSVEYSMDDMEINTKRKLAMLDLLLEAEGRGEIDLAGIRDEVNTFMFEGHDTTAMALTFALMLLADHPEIQDRVYAEIISIAGSTISQLTEMKYLEAVVKETLRLYPSVPFISREITDDFMMGDIPVPKGLEVAIHIYDLHRRPDLYSDPEEFRPERFLDGGPKHPFAFVPFSAGPRNCIGQKFAMQEMKCVLSEICRNFKFTRSDRRLPTLISDLVLRPHKPIYVKFFKR